MGPCRTVLLQPQRSSALLGLRGLGKKMALFLVDLATFLIKVYTNDSPKLSALHLFILCLALHPPAPPQAGPSSPQQALGGKCESLGVIFKIGNAI